ncbi:hypothetical protein X975_14631, partial [Stegodyphus mimosarum]
MFMLVFAILSLRRFLGATGIPSSVRVFKGPDNSLQRWFLAWTRTVYSVYGDKPGILIEVTLLAYSFFEAPSSNQTLYSVTCPNGASHLIARLSSVAFSRLIFVGASGGAQTPLIIFSFTSAPLQKIVALNSCLEFEHCSGTFKDFSEKRAEKYELPCKMHHEVLALTLIRTSAFLSTPDHRTTNFLSQVTVTFHSASQSALV